MHTRAIATLLATITICAVLGAGCKEDPPPPPLPEPSPSGKAKARRPGLDPKARFKGARVPKISPQTMKAYRVEICYFGTMELRVVRDAYLASLGGAAPGPGKIPSLGDYPKNAKRAATAKKHEEAARKRRATAGGSANPHARGRPPGRAHSVPPRQPSPFLRHLRSYSVARTLQKPRWDDLDKALVDFDKYAHEMQNLLLDANRYYQRKRYDKDDFKHGGELHTKLTKAFAELDERLAGFDKVVRAWRDGLPAASEKHDETGKLAQDGLAAARALTLALMATPRDEAAAKEGLEKVGKLLDNLKDAAKKNPKQAHGRVVTPKLEVFVEAAKKAAAVTGKLTAHDVYPVTAALTDLIEAKQRGLAQMLRSRGETEAGGPLRLIKPRLRGAAGRPPMRPKARPPKRQ